MIFSFYNEDFGLNCNFIVKGSFEFDQDIIVMVYFFVGNWGFG